MAKIYKNTPTGKLRYKEKTVPYQGSDVLGQTIKVLQQEWYSEEYKEFEWKDVPTVKEDES